jgi:hypothetical protein
MVDDHRVAALAQVEAAARLRPAVRHAGDQEVAKPEHETQDPRSLH